MQCKRALWIPQRSNNNYNQVFLRVFLFSHNKPVRKTLMKIMLPNKKTNPQKPICDTKSTAINRMKHTPIRSSFLEVERLLMKAIRIYSNV